METKQKIKYTFIIIIMLFLLVFTITSALAMPSQSDFCEGLNLNLNLSSDITSCNEFWDLLTNKTTYINNTYNNYSNITIINNTYQTLTTEGNTSVSNYYTNNNSNTGDYYTKAEVDSLINSIQEKSELEQLREELEALKETPEEETTTETTLSEDKILDLIRQQSSIDESPTRILTPTTTTETKEEGFGGIKTSWIIIALLLVAGYLILTGKWKELGKKPPVTLEQRFNFDELQKQQEKELIKEVVEKKPVVPKKKREKKKEIDAEEEY